ncbi:class V lanthionine synthetase subunit LxmK [Amycolatopsis echigonensis]|uniref:Phosphotransferase n=1 Tax=Amycolatopsis echigonensis TaxID=2576905 RepID=A0A8E1W8X6_9PSEU|nr:class V lanthionine synthetase subunit LxmK [Amycolatopsis echigonensis]MBB2505782.1 phosphotransferase [Amycolatopsis echigonensis]
MLSTRDTCRVDEVLARFGIGEFDWTTATSASGRNENWLGNTVEGQRIFIKALAGSEIEVAHGLRRTEAFYQTHRSGGAALRTTTLIGQDAEAAVQVFDGLDGARDGRQLAADGRFDPAMATQAGTAIAALHASPPDDLLKIERSLPPLPQQNMLAGLSSEMFYASSRAQLEAWRLLQQDHSIVNSIGLLENATAGVVKVPVHGDLCLDQFLIADGRLHVIDWEAFQLGDPARDLGNFVGEWLHHTVVKFLADRAKNGSGRPVQVPNIPLTPSWRPWLAVRGTVESFWLAYRNACPGPSAKMTRRIVLFAAWHLFMRMLTDAMFQPRLDGAGHTLFRLGRVVLRDPDRFAPILGLTT